MMFLDVSLSYFSVPAGINSFQTRHDGQNLGKVETSPQHFAEDHHLLSFLGLEKTPFFLVSSLFYCWISPVIGHFYSHLLFIHHGHGYFIAFLPINTKT